MGFCVALSEQQRNKISKGRKITTPSFYNATTQANEIISSDTEAALIVVGSSVKQKVSNYLDLLIDANPSKTDRDDVTAKAAAAQLANLEGVINELATITTKFDGFRDDLLGGDTIDPTITNGMVPILHSITTGVSNITNQLARARFLKKFSRTAAKLYGTKVSDDQKKEWRSWKRVVLAYP